MTLKNPKPVAVKVETPPPSGGSVSRRSFFNFLWGALGLAALAELVWVAFSFLSPGRQGAASQPVTAVVSAGSVESFPPGTVEAFQRGQFYLVRLDGGGFLALSCKCTHLGCTVPWVAEEKKFLCPCHASSFDITGNVTAAPAPRALDIFPIAFENNIVKVDTSRRIKRSGFETKQVTYPPKG
jgi:cytochrome b6-f complex iron-sulfur subunit